jgi:hypothetical protein|tara:strand:- start:98 stop:490 length:393 start_codon:yes stop_codon:yes gene_type:complete
MAIFNSRELNRPVHSTELAQLSPQDLELLRAELFDCIEGINKSLSEVKDFTDKHGYPHDEDWLHRAKKKLRICMQFAVKIEAFNTGTPMTYKEAYEKRFREILLEELGPDSLKKIEDEASELARADLERE